MHTLIVTRWPIGLKVMEIMTGTGNLTNYNYGGQIKTWILEEGHIFHFTKPAQSINIFLMFALIYADKCISVVPIPYQVHFFLEQMETIIKRLTQPKCRMCSPLLVNTFISNSYTNGLGNIVEEGDKTLWETENQRLSCRTVFPRNVRRCTQTVSPARLSKHELDKANNTG